MIKAKIIKVTSIENEEIMLVIRMTKIITLKNDNNHNSEDKKNQNWQSYKSIKALKYNKKCSSKSNSCLLKKKKGSESHILLERKNHI